LLADVTDSGRVPVVILAGGLGTRLREETAVRPKPMVEIGGRPILWHIMKTYETYGFDRFLIPVGYKGHLIKEFFLGFHNRHIDFTVELGSGRVEALSSRPEKWIVSVIDTGADTATGGRILRLREHLDGATFMVTYGDGVADVDVRKLLEFHRSHGGVATVTAVHPSARFGAMELDDRFVRSFAEKPQAGGGWINGGFFVFEPDIFRYIKSDASVLEREVIDGLIHDKQLFAFRHEGFWEPMDTQRDLEHLNAQWQVGDAPWKVWDD
jgi:glucose-1-phosphate cytidylyltransferase